MRTLIKARYVVAYQNGGHALLENGQVAFEGNTVSYVGRNYPGHPQDMLHEMRVAAVLAKVVEGDPRLATARDVLTSATLGSARAPGREDLGRIAPGAKADLVLVKLDTLGMSPVRDPIKNLVFSASRHDIDTVIVDGKTVVAGGRIEGVDEGALARELQRAAERLWQRTLQTDWAKRGIDQISPQSLPRWQDE